MVSFLSSTSAFPFSNSSSSSGRTAIHAMLLNLSALLVLFAAFSSTIPSVYAIKFKVQAERYPQPKCIWNAAHDNALVVVTANVGSGNSQRMDVEIVDSSPRRNVYLSKRNISGETRLAVTAHGEGDVGVCFKNHLDVGVAASETQNYNRIVDLDVDIGADAVDYNAIAAKESLSGLETEMRKIEGLVKEIQDEMMYLKKREMRFQKTNQSTNDRVQNFALFTFVSLLCLGVWQIVHLRSFFKRKYLID